MSTLASEKQKATRFFWSWLIAATSASVLGNVTHAVLMSDGSSTVVAAVSAVVPPAVLLGGTHGLSLMVRTQIVGRLYKASMALLLGLSVCAFVLSFGALYELAVVYGGMSPRVAWLWPLAIDFSVGLSTVALLALTTGKRARREAAQGRRPARKAPRKASPKRPQAVKVVAA